MNGLILVAAAMMTAFGEKVTSENCWRDYPRPQLERDGWTCLNGDWDYAVTSVTNTPGRPTKWDGKIRVPYAIESALSGVGRLLEPDEFLWYTRTIVCVPKKGRRILLHFDGVDYRTMVFIGHREVTDVPHEGAHDPFTLDITDFVTTGENELTVCTWDPTGRRAENAHFNSRGKQDLVPRGCFYTRCSGIWQSVWMETVSESYVADYTVVPDIDAGTATFTFEIAGRERDKDVKVKVFDADGKTIAQAKGDADKPLVVQMPEDFKLWSPETPNLYSFAAKYEHDSFSGYFAMRKIEKRKDAKGFLRFFLNNKPYFLLGTLDQGWWPDGLLTPPSEEAMAYDIRTLKDCGFNMMRKHIKVEPRRYYALCDKLGLLVIQDLPCFNGIPSSPYDWKTVIGYGMQRQELKAMIATLKNAPSIIGWLAYNEGWSQPGQFLTHSTFDWIRRADPSRLVFGPSGYCDFEGGSPHSLNGSPDCEWPWKHLPMGQCEAADTVDMHAYRGPGMPPANERRISFLGEFGGLGHPVDGHLWKKAEGSWGYGGIEDTKTREGLEEAYLALMSQVEADVAKGLSGSVYTQTTDVEIEINGLLTYDRKVLKYNPAVLRAAHEKICRALTAP